MAEAFLAPVLEVLLDKLVLSPVLEYARQQKVETSLEEWKRTVSQIKAVLNDAEQMQLRDTAVKMWLDDLKSLAYDIEDVLDEFHTEAKLRSLERGPETSCSKVRNLIPCFHHRGLIFNKKIGQKIKKISEELDLINKRRSDLHLREGVVGASTASDKRLTSSSVDKSGVYGRDADMEKIMELVLSDDEVTTAAHKVRVIPIVGMGGVGKTTLAQMVYNHERVEENFRVRGWACVSDQFDLVGTTKAILESVTGSSTDSRNLQLLQDNLKKELGGKKFFLVLDDVWEEDPNSWSNLRAPLIDGAQGSVILVTTRQHDVASIMRATPSHHLTELSDENCWSLFAHIAFENISTDALQNLEPIGREIIKKCKGLPLAAKTVGGLLSSKQDESVWKEMLNSEIWDLPAQKSSILPALHLSYHYLPQKFKRCFAYCSLFPKDYEFEKEELILLWVAEGLVGDLKSGETLEETGETCFRNLLLRSFFQQSSRKESLFVMHDLIHDLAESVFGDLCLKLEVGKKNQNVKKARHVSYIPGEFDVSKKFDLLHETNNIRTFLPLGDLRGFRDLRFNFLADKVLNLLPTLRYLRILSLSGYKIDRLPDSFENLRHLRYLDLSYTAIKELPNSIGMLLNLQILKLSACHHLTVLPSEISKLINLRHFDISETKLEAMPRGIRELKDLRRLTTFVVGKHSAARIKELQDLSYLRGALAILNLQNVVDASDVSEANLKNKKDIDDLVFAWHDDATVDDAHNSTRVLENLQPHYKLRKLRIENYHGEEFPNWLGDHSFGNLVVLQLRNCKSCSSLPRLGQLQSLRELLIVNMDEVQNVGAEFYGNGCGSSSFKPFRSLVILRFERMMKWEKWVCSGVEFLCLKELYIKECPQLKGDIPKDLPALIKLEIGGCGQLMCCLPAAPFIRELRLDGCDDVMVRSAGQLTSIGCLEISKICKIPAELGQLHSLVELIIYECREVKELPPILHNLISLNSLKIWSCPSLLSLQEIGLPPMLEWLDIRGCSSLQSLPDTLAASTSLRSLRICGCEKLDLRLGEDMMHDFYSSLTSLDIEDFRNDHFTSFPMAFFVKLGTLVIENCENLESLSIPDGLRHVDLTSLRYLYLSNCPNLACFPEGGLPTPNLRWLNIQRCEKLKSLPQQMRSLLTSLEELKVEKCPEIEYSFPEGGLPNSLRVLRIIKCKKLMARRKEWSLQRLTSLRELEIKGVRDDEEEERLKSFPEEVVLPSTLTDLRIINFPNLIGLDNKGLHHLTSLENLMIEKCEKLKYLPKQGLPASISRLEIRKCPLLKKRYSKRDKGKEWPNISHIPCIIFDKAFVIGGYEDEEVILS